MTSPIKAAPAHTPGPWTIKERTRLDSTIQVTIGDRAREVCHLSGYAADVSQVEADARLIAQAPALLEALADMLIDVDGSDCSSIEFRMAESARTGLHARARAAITAARGQSDPQTQAFFTNRERHEGR